MDITENPEGFFANLSSISNDEKPKEEKIEKPEEPKTSNASITEDPESFFSNLSKTPEQKSQEETGGDFFKTAYKAIDEFLVQPKDKQEPTPDQSFLTSIQSKKSSDLDKFDVDYIKSLTPDQRYSVMQARKDIPLDILSDDEQRQLHENEKSKGILSFPKEKGFWYNLLDGYNEMAQGAFDIGKTAAKVAVGSAEVPYRIIQGASGDYGAALEGEKLLSPEDKKEVEAWRVNAINLANTPMSSGDPRQKDIYLDSKYLAKILEKLTPEQRQQVKETEAKKIADAKSSFYSFFAPAFELPGAVANAGKTILAGGIGIGDWGNEKMAAALGPEMEQKAKELSFANWRSRRKIKQAHEAYTREIPDVYARMYENPALKSALNEITLSQGPSVEETAKSRGISEDAAKELLKKEAEKNNEVALKELEQQLPEVSESAKLTGEFLLPRGIGMELFGAAGLATEATKNVARGLKFLNKTEDEINAIMEADRALQRSRTAQRYAARQEIGKDVSRAGEKMEEIGQKFRPISEFIEKKTSNLSKIALPVTGAVYGYQHDPEHPILGSLKYGLGGLGLKYAKEIPAFTKELGEAIRVSAPGTTFETLGKVPEGSKIKEKILANGGKGIDNLLANAKEYAQTGIHGGALGLAVGLSSEDDPEIIKKIASDGLLYSVGTRGIQHVLGKFSVDPVIEERNRKIDNYKIYQEYKNSTPETQKNIDDLTDWNNVVQAYESKANEYKDELNDSIQSGDQSKIEKSQKNVDALDSSIKNLKKANLQTRNELGRQFLKSYVAANELANSALLPGQNNVGFHILTTNEIFQKLRSDPANANVPDADIAKTAAQQGFYSGIGTAEHVPNAPITPGETGMTFDRTKNSIVLNADALRDRMVKYRQTPIDALWHELSHYLFKVPEFKKLMENVESSLFSTEVKDISGKVIASTSGIYSPKDLVDMYRKSYMQGHDAPSIESLAKLSGVWDESRGTLDEQKVANYMREEVMADLFGEAGQRHIASTMDGGKRSIIENAIVKTKQLILDKALARFRGLGGKGDVVRAANSGAEFSPEVMKAAKNALDAMRDLNGAISPAIEAPAKPLISKAQMAKSKAIAGRYGINSGLFETKMTASVFDANGNKIGESMPVSELAFEGAFQSTPEGLKQLSGYGSLPNELTGVNIPEGGKIVVGKEFVVSPDGKTPVMLSSADVKKAVKGRSNLIRTALSEHDDGSPATFRAVSDDGLTFRGTFNPEQIKAIQNLPESIVPRSIKENILKANESIAAADGTRWIADYAAMMDDNGKYKAFSPKLYDFVPIGMHFSKDGNFLLTAINVGRIFQKMRLWNERMPGKLKMWDNNLEMAFDDFANIYLQNWKNGRPGETGLDKNPTIALVKKNIFNDLLNVTKEQYNPDISIIPRRKGDPRGKNLDRVITSFRVDHIAEMIKNEEATKLPVNYGFAKINFMPERMEGEAPTQEKQPSEENFYKDVTKLVPEVVEAANAYKDGKINQDEYLSIVKQYMPYREMDSVPDPASKKQIYTALTEDKIKNIGVPSKKLNEGYNVGLRLDIPAYRDYGTWVVAVHDAKTGEIIGYEPAAVINNVEFTSSPLGALGVATAEKNKSSFARIIGDWEKMSPEDAKAEADKAIVDPEYVQVGMNPARHSYFYNRKDGQPLIKAKRVIQIGGLVLAKNPEFTSPKDERFLVKKYGIPFMPERPAEERIVAATYTDPRTGEVREGVNHKAANPNAPDEQTDRESRYYGFKTDAGRVVDREEAYRIAEASGQLKEATSEEDRFNADRGVLHSNMVEMEPTIGEKTEISPKIGGRPTISEKPQSSEMIGADTIKPADIETSAKPESDAVIKPFSNALVSSAGLINFLPAYHGTPFEVDKFKLANIGTGEGAQAYGWGLYFAQARKVGEEYKNKIRDFAEIDKINQKMSKLAEIMQEDSSGYRQFKSEKGRKAAKEYDNLLIERKTLNEAQGNLYKVDLDVKDDDLLDWDKPLSEQSEKVKNAFNLKIWNEDRFKMTDLDGIDNVLSKDATLGEAYQLMGEPKDVSLHLLELGILGIRYLDGTSRKQGEGTYNYVVFDENLITILDKNDKPVAGELPTKQQSGGIQFMPARKEKDKKESTKKTAIESIEVTPGDETTLPVLQETKNGKPVLDQNKEPKYIKQKYELLTSPFITNYQGEPPEDTTKPDYKKLAYDVTGPAQIKINNAIDSGAVDSAANIMVEKTKQSMKNPEIAAGSGWYSRMRENLLNALGVEGREILSQLLGATSAKTPVNENFLQAMDAYEGIKAGRYDSNRKAYLEMLASEKEGKLNDLIDERNYIAVIKNKISEIKKATKKLTGNKQKELLVQADKLNKLISIKPEYRTKKNKFSIVINASGLMPLRSNNKKFNANSMAVMKVIAGTWLDNRKAPKTPNFAGNLSGRTVQATIDVWAARFMRQILHEGFGKAWRIQPKSESAVSNEDFALGQIIMERAAKKLDMNPDDLQAILWFAEKHNWDNNGWTGKEGAEKSSFDEIFNVFFPKGKKPLTFSEASEIFKSQKNKDESIDDQIDEDTDEE